MKRFQSVSAFFLPLACIILTALLSRVDAASADEGDQRPNIIFILADDLGMYTLPAYGGNEFETPNLDRLCKSGMLLSQCHSPMCAATRRVLLSGRSFAQRSQPLNLPQVMKQNGYDVGFVGKWMQDEMPWNHGFEEGLVQVNWYKYWGPSFVVFNSGGYLQEHNLKYPLPTDMKDHGLPFEGPDAKAFKLRDEYGPRVLNRFALDYVERHKDNPFFLYYPMKLPHWPTMPTPDTPMGARETNPMRLLFRSPTTRANARPLWNSEARKMPASRLATSTEFAFSIRENGLNNATTDARTSPREQSFQHRCLTLRYCYCYTQGRSVGSSRSVFKGDGIMKRISRDRQLTPAEAAKYNAIRDEIEAEKPEINARIRKRMSEKRKKNAAESEGKTFGQRVRCARESLGQSQVNLAAAAGISQGYLSQLETDQREPTLSIAARLAKALDISLDELASGAA